MYFYFQYLVIIYIDADLNLGFGEEMAPAFPNYGFNIANEMGFQRRYVYPRGIVSRLEVSISTRNVRDLYGFLELGWRRWQWEGGTSISAK